MRAGQVVLAVPPALTATMITFNPALPGPLARLAAVTPVWMANTVKVVVRYDDAFWRRHGFAGAAISHIGPLREVHDMSGPDGTPAALFGFALSAAMPGPEATPGPAPGPGPELLQRRAVRQLVRLFGPEAAEPSEIHIQDWGAEPYTCPPGPALTDHTPFGHPHYQEPALGGRLHWASTETAILGVGHVEGALQAAARAATAVLRHRDLVRATR